MTKIAISSLFSMPQYENNSSSIVQGRLVEVTPAGEARVSLKGKDGLLSVRTIVRFASEAEALSAVGKEVLLHFDDSEAQSGVLIGIIGSSLYPIGDAQGADATRRGLTIESDQLTLRGRQNVTIECGLGNIQIKRNGAVIIKGTQVSSRAKGSNKIRGSTVNIN